jgi:hypothetical protein
MQLHHQRFAFQLAGHDLKAISGHSINLIEKAGGTTCPNAKRLHSKDLARTRAKPRPPRITALAGV